MPQPFIAFRSLAQATAVAAATLAFQPGLASADAALDKAVGEVRSMIAATKSFRASLEVTDRQGGVECITTATVAVSREYGFRMISETQGIECRRVTDFQTQYEYFPAEHRARKITADRDEIKQLLKRPVLLLNPVSQLDHASLKLTGTETFEGEPVYHFSGTTTTQFLAAGAPVKSEMEAWISTKDGLPRKTVEKIGGNAATTIFRKVEINPTLAADEFKFTPGKDVEVIDENSELARHSQQAGSATAEPAASKAAARRKGVGKAR